MGSSKTKTLVSSIQLLQASFFLLLAFTLALHAILSSTSHLNLLHPNLRLVVFSLLWCTLLALLAHLSTRPRPVLLLDYSCFLPDTDRKCSFEVSQYITRRSRRYTQKSEDFMRGIFLKSGLGDETYVPASFFQTDYQPSLRSAFQEAEEGMTLAVEALLAKTDVPASSIDLVIVSCGMFAPAPSLTSLLVHRFAFPDSVATYNLSAMGCSFGVGAVDLAGRILNSSRRVRYALVVVTEGLALNWYFGDNRSMLVTNCIFRAGAAAVLVTNDPAKRCAAKMELVHSLRTHRGADDAAYTAAYQQEDEDGTVGVALKKDLIRVAGEGLYAHVRLLMPKVLPWSQLLQVAMGLWGRKGETTKRAAVPDFTTAFEHICVHTGGKAVIESVGRLMRLEEEVTEPARMCLHRFGNTSSSLVFYELAYFDAKGRVRRGDRMWMLAFGTGFKVCSLVWRALRDSAMDSDNPWKDCIHSYPLKTW
ncbi:hypothetical protein Cni_G29222 [Canna indica]|uniref:3-ketoacyl-CoA synthase n=1 Tax=Canna indica TaxID=4628 RepID=A0AAQ3LB80_9LILI|nr:hypothetical protein Cni_G29222 [Canna indica]